jgi:hypothetical protein
MDIMIDIETLGLAPNSAVIQIGAAQFELGGDGIVGKPFLVSVNQDYYYQQGVIEHNGYFVDPSTEAWWQEQPEAALKSLTMNLLDSPQEAEDALRQWMRRSGFVTGNDFSSCVWSQGYLDVLCLENIARQNAKRPVWEFYQVRDSRTMIREMTRNFIPPDLSNILPDNLVLHRGDHDAIRQVYTLQHAVRAYNNDNNPTPVSYDPESGDISIG